MLIRRVPRLATGPCTSPSEEAVAECEYHFRLKHRAAIHPERKKRKVQRGEVSRNLIVYCGQRTLSSVGCEELKVERQ